MYGICGDAPEEHLNASSKHFSIAQSLEDDTVALKTVHEDVGTELPEEEKTQNASMDSAEKGASKQIILNT